MRRHDLIINKNTHLLPMMVAAHAAHDRQVTMTHMFFSKQQPVHMYSPTRCRNATATYN
jgi:hypothetical protein